MPNMYTYYFEYCNLQEYISTLSLNLKKTVMHVLFSSNKIKHFFHLNISKKSRNGVK